MKNLLVALFLFFSVNNVRSQVHYTYLWHMHQPTYWGDFSQSNPNRYQMVKESEDMKNSGANTYSDGLAHPLNNLNEIFSMPDRVNAYQYRPKSAVQSIMNNPKAGAQMTYGGSLIENINSLGAANQWGYSPNWKNDVNTAHNWQTSGGKPRLDVMGFTMQHTLSPLASDEVLKKEIQAHKFYQLQNFGYYSNGYWPAEASFSERIIQVLKDEGFSWTVVANSHLARTLSDYPLVFGTNGCNIDPPNKADKVETNGTHWYNGQIDGRGGQFAAPYCFMPHKAKYVDPESGIEHKITVVPMADLESYRDGFSPQGVGDIQSNIAPYASPVRPPLVLFAHDGDNAWGGGSSYYNEAVPGFANQAVPAGFVPTTIEQYLADFPVPETDVVKVEDGSWVNAANDWGSPQFINWFWPLRQANDNSKFNPNGWTEDVRNTAVLYAADNFCKMAEQLSGGVDISDVVNPSSGASPAEKAWHFLLPGYDSGNAYYGLALDLEIKATLAANRAIGFANQVITANPGVDNTKPSVLVPQRYPYNPGEIGFGPNYGYQQLLNSADFSVWTLAFDVTGIESAVLKYRIDADGQNPLSTNQNEIYSGGDEVGDWIDIEMNMVPMPLDNITNNPEVSFFMLPDHISNLYYADINGISNKLLDYYIEVTDNNGNVEKTKIQHVWVGENLNISPTVTIAPAFNYSASPIDVTIAATDSNDPAPVIYYTTDGTEPTELSATEVGSTMLNITQTTTIKAFAKDFENNQSETVSKTYFIGDVPSITLYFKPPASWGNTVPKIYYWNIQPTGIDNAVTWPGVSMNIACNGWYSYTIAGAASASVIFNNGSSGVGTNQTIDLFAESNAYYVWGSGWVETPIDLENPCLTVSPPGGSFVSGSNVEVSLAATSTEVGDVTIYYTLDGSTPSVSSASFDQQGVINISSNTTLRTFAASNLGASSNIQTHDYTFSDAGITVYFYPNPGLPAWSGVTPRVYYWNVVGGNIAPASWPGVLMVPHTDGWYKYTFPGVTSLNVIFNNGSGGVGTNQTPDITNVTSDIWYTWEGGLTAIENSAAPSITLAPNPTSGLVEVRGIKLVKKVAIYNSLGALVKQHTLESNSISLEELPSGMYYLKLLDENGNIYFEQVVKR